MDTNVSRPLVIYSCHRVQTNLNTDFILRRKPVDVYSLGDDAYLEQVFGSSTEPFYGRASGSISAPEGTGGRVQIGAAVGGALPVGAATVLAAGSNYPAAGPVGTLSAATISCFFLPLGGLAAGQIPASGRVTTNGSRQVASVVVDHGGTGYTNTGAAEFELVASCNDKFWKLKFDHQKADPGLQAFYAAHRRGDFRLFGMWDDHEGPLSNWTFATNDMTSRYPGEAWWQNQGGQAAMLAYWRTAVRGFDLISAAYYDNPPKRANASGNIPAGLVGAPGVSAADFFEYYHAQDYGPNMEPGGNRLRILHLDCLTFTSPYDAADDGTGTSGKTKLGYAQVQWALDQMRDAKARGMVCVILTPKDIGNVDNGDSWRGTGGGALGYNGELNYILGVIEAEDLPLAGWVGGDRHQPHVALFDSRNGDAGTVFSLCPCPYGADPGGLTAYPQNIWTNRDVDAAVFGTVSLTATAVRFEIIDAHSDEVLFSADVPFGQRRPTAIRAAEQQLAKPRANLVPSYVYAGTWELRPTSGLPIRSRAYFTDVGQYGSDWIWDGTYWRPAAPVTLASLTAAQTKTDADTTLATLLTRTLPAGLISPGCKLDANHKWTRAGASAAAVTISVTLGGSMLASTGTLMAAGIFRGTSRIISRSMTSQLGDYSGGQGWGAQAGGTFAALSLNQANALTFAATAQWGAAGGGTSSVVLEQLDLILYL